MNTIVSKLFPACFHLLSFQNPGVELRILKMVEILMSPKLGLLPVSVLSLSAPRLVQNRTQNFYFDILEAQISFHIFEYRR